MKEKKEYKFIDLFKEGKRLLALVDCHLCRGKGIFKMKKSNWKGSKVYQKLCKCVLMTDQKIDWIKI
jgi:hypothetical protein